MEAVQPVDVEVCNFSVHVGKKGGKENTIVRNVNLQCKSGTILAILGGSGSGKTTLLSCMASRSDLRTSGEILFNGQKSKSFIKEGKVGYVQQHDYLLPYLTVTETLIFAANLRLKIPKEQRLRLVQEIIRELGLVDCANTFIGNEVRRGVSGGEMRRVSVGLNLLTNPSILFLDEPSTGLDSFASSNLVKLLKKLSQNGRTVCISIHQPRSDVYNLFDNIVLLSKGNLVYSGPKTKVVSYFRNLPFDEALLMNVGKGSIVNRRDYHMCVNDKPATLKDFTNSYHVVDITDIDDCDKDSNSNNYDDHNDNNNENNNNQYDYCNYDNDAYDNDNSTPPETMDLRKIFDDKRSNPADLLIDITSVDNRNNQLERISRKRMEYLTTCWTNHTRVLKTSISNHATTINAKDHDITVESIDNDIHDHYVHDGNDITHEKITCINNVYKNNNESITSEDEQEYSDSRKVSRTYQIYLLTCRGIKSTLNDLIGYWGMIGQCIIMGLLLGFIFFQLVASPAGVLSRRALMYVVLTLQPYNMMMLYIYKLTGVLRVFDRERLDRMYRLLPFMGSSFLITTLFELFIPVLFSVLIYFLSGLRGTSTGNQNSNSESDLDTHFGIFLAINVTIHYFSIGLAYFCVSLNRDFAGASMIANGIYTLVCLASGFLVNVDSIPIWLRWTKYISFLYWGYMALSLNEFRNNVYNCALILNNTTPDPQCNGNFILTSFSIDIDETLYLPLGVLLGFTLAFYVLSALILKYIPPSSAEHKKAIDKKKTEKENKKAIESQDSNQNTKYPPPSVNDDEQTNVKLGFLDNQRLQHRTTIKLENLSLKIVNGNAFQNVRSKKFKSREFRRKDSTGPRSTNSRDCLETDSKDIYQMDKRSQKNKVILSNINVKFESGQLTAIFGASGSGKTSLLNILTGRKLATRGLDKARYSGTIKYNDKVMNLNNLSEVCSFVQQHDDHLLPFLTCRETLKFAACLQMDPKVTTKEDINNRVDNVISILGLSDCSNIAVGNELKKGLSGGEKRRLSIGVQLLTDPAVLVLDEPTSGLDTFIAYNVMEVLKGLSASGRCVICSIHQPRTSIYKMVDSILLLTKGGRVCYAGSRQAMVPYFECLGHVLPLFFNPADFILDLTSIDTRTSDSERETSNVVNNIVYKWAEKGETEKHYCLQSAKVNNIKSEITLDLSALPNSNDSNYNINRNDNDIDIDNDRNNDNSGGSKEIEGDVITTSVIKSENVYKYESKMIENETRRNEGPIENDFEYPFGLMSIRRKAPFSRAFPIVLRRSFTNSRRQPVIFVFRVLQMIGVGIVIVLFYYNAIDHNATYALQNRIGLLYQPSSLLFVGMLDCIAFYPQELRTFENDFLDKAYSVEVFFFSYMALELPSVILSALLFGLLANVAVGMTTNGSIYFVFCFCILALVSAGQSIGIIFLTLVRTSGLGVSIMSLILSFFCIMCGLFSADMPAVLDYVNYVSVVRYTARITSINEFQGQIYTCPPLSSPSSSSIITEVTNCFPFTGDSVLETFGFEVDDYNLYLILLAVLVIIYRFVAYLVLKLNYN